ncbi:MAG: hypothetical protein JWQ38_2056 [Flavipsychrobacter sp.]|nr:hypothetical protein [Flavipsychrobacter sp.]
MKRILIISLLALAACNNTDTKKDESNDPNKIPANIVNNPHTAEGMDTVTAAMKPVMTFKDTLHNFGAMHEDEVVQYDFAFTNTGKSPLIISNAQASCGCTVPQYPHDPIAPGESGIMKVSFNSAGKFGHQEKSVAVHTNSTQGVLMLYIQADVAKKK